MKEDIKLDGVSFGADFIHSFKELKDLEDELSQPHWSHIWPGLTKKERKENIKNLYKIGKL